MEPTTAQPINATNTCTSCGANLEYDFTTNTNKCPYCGTAFKVNKPAGATNDTAPDAGCIRFKNDISKFKEAVTVFLCSGDKTPLNLLFQAKFSSVDMLYVPFYQVSGNYEGYYNTLDKHGKTVGQNIPLNDNFSGVVYGGSDELDSKNTAAFADRADKSLIAPISNIDTEGTLLADSQSEQRAWDNWGQLKIAKQVYGNLGKIDPVNQHQHYLKYNVQNSGKFYYPAWRVFYDYEGTRYAIYMDDLTGELTGGKPDDFNINPPQRSTVFKKYLLVGFCIWCGMLILRGALAAIIGGEFDISDHTLNNIVFSEPVGPYWFLRGVIFLGVFPLLMATVFYNNIKNRYYNKLTQFRNRNLDLLASGRKGIIFNRTGQ